MRTGPTFAVVLHPLDGGVAEETHEVDVQNPEVFTRQHKINSLVNFKAELYVLNVYLNMFNIRSHRWIAGGVKRFVSIANIDSDTMSKDIDGETNNQIVIFNGRHKKQAVIDLL